MYMYMYIHVYLHPRTQTCWLCLSQTQSPLPAQKIHKYTYISQRLHLHPFTSFVESATKCLATADSYRYDSGGEIERSLCMTLHVPIHLIQVTCNALYVYSSLLLWTENLCIYQSSSLLAMFLQLRQHCAPAHSSRASRQDITIMDSSAGS